MHGLLEKYLAEVAEHLASLPKARRSEELAEMRQHLGRSATVNREQGQSEEEAVQTALVQFGSPKELAEQMVMAWRRGEIIRKRSFWGAAAATPITLGVLMDSLVNGSLLERVWPSFNAFFLQHPVYGNAVIHAVFFLLYGLAGMVVGTAFPKQAVKGVCLGLAFFTLFQRMYPSEILGWLVLALTLIAVGIAVPKINVRSVCLVVAVAALVWMGRGGLIIPTHLRQFWFRLEEMGWLLTAVLGAWAMSRWRGRHSRLIRA